MHIIQLFFEVNQSAWASAVLCWYYIKWKWHAAVHTQTHTWTWPQTCTVSSYQWRHLIKTSLRLHHDNTIENDTYYGWIYEYSSSVSVSVASFHLCSVPQSGHTMRSHMAQRSAESIQINQLYRRLRSGLAGHWLRLMNIGGCVAEFPFKNATKSPQCDHYFPSMCCIVDHSLQLLVSVSRARRVRQRYPLRIMYSDGDGLPSTLRRAALVWRVAVDQ